MLGLGDIGPLAALPGLEGKAALLKRFAGIDAWPLCLNTIVVFGALLNALRVADKKPEDVRVVISGVFRGLLDARAARLTTASQCAAAHAIAGTVHQIDAEHIVPSVFGERLVPAIAHAVADI